MKIIKLTTILAVVAVLASCAHSTGGSSGAYTKGNYRCHAKGYGYKASGWGASRIDAEARALDRCNRYSNSTCRITSCYYMG